MFKESPVKVLFVRMWKEDDAVLAFEWVLLVTLLTIGIVGGVAAARDAIIDELGDVALAMISVSMTKATGDGKVRRGHEGLGA